MLVTERDEVVAELRPARRQAPVADRLEELLEALAAAGEITPGRAAEGRLDLAQPRSGTAVGDGAGPARRAA